VRAKIVVAALALATAGCNFWYNEVPSPDDLMHAVPWFDHMIGSRAVYPYQTAAVPRNTPAGIVPVGRVEADWRVGDPTMAPMPQYGFDTVVANRLTRPADLAAPSAARGEELFQTYCAVCHGPAGRGGGTVVMGAPPLNTERVAALSDGHVYSVIRYGIRLMPQYGDKIFRLEDRWAVVDYVRSLQSGSQP
jgi:mono/diheme cytochrome c family protein